MNPLLRTWRWRILAAVLALALTAWACWEFTGHGTSGSTNLTAASEEIAEAPLAAVRDVCSKCHAYPPPDCFPRDVWRQELRQAYDFLRTSSLRGNYPSLENVVRFYEARAPLKFTIASPSPTAHPAPVSFVPTHVRCAGSRDVQVPGTTFVDLVRLTPGRKADLLVCDAWSGRVMICDPQQPENTWKTLGRVSCPARATVVDLDGDGILDVLVADLGYLLPTNAKFGSVVWLRGRPDGSYEPFVLADGLGRVADVQAADFRGTGRLDLVVAVFGGRTTGEVLLLENETTDWSKPRFTPRVLDDRHGSIHVPVCDLNGDGKPDFIALISQEHETVVAFLNDGKGGFRKETIYRAPHPAFGCSGIQVVDLNKDGKLDVVLTNGDTLDPPLLLKPYHGIRWLENRGTFPFTEHHLADMPGVMRALATDVDGDGNLDIVAVSFLSGQIDRAAVAKLDSIIWLQQTKPGEFVRHSLETGAHDHMTCVLGDWRGDGTMGLITGTFSPPNQPPGEHKHALTLWEPAKKSNGGAR